jgi:hypothetical protein
MLYDEYGFPTELNGKPVTWMSAEEAAKFCGVTIGSFFARFYWKNAKDRGKVSFFKRAPQARPVFCKEDIERLEQQRETILVAS